MAKHAESAAEVPEEVMALLRRFGKASNRRDVDEIVACVTDDFEWVLAEGPEAPHGRVVRGAEELRSYLSERDREIPELRFGETEVMAVGDRVVGLFRARGRREDGSPIDVRGCDLYTLRDGRIARKDSYWKRVLAEGGE
jgi:ketosteroid isomerase-like protein